MNVMKLRQHISVVVHRTVCFFYVCSLRTMLGFFFSNEYIFWLIMSVTEIQTHCIVSVYTGFVSVDFKIGRIKDDPVVVFSAFYLAF